MKILITSIVDLKKSQHNRPHQFVKYLSKKHDVTVLSINDWWKGGQDNLESYSKDFNEVFNRIDYHHLTDKKIIEVSGIIIGECTEHWEELTGEIKDNKGNDVRVVRHNGIVENNHRWSRMHARRRTGRSRTTNDMAKYGALTAVLSNLENETYVKKVLGDIPDFVYELQSIGDEEIREAEKLIKPYPNEFLVSSDSERLSMLQDFITILEQSEKKDKIDVKNWLNRSEWANPLLTP
ncbi:MAG: hypothetical protein Q8O41_07000 [Candidatus Methanoperedens sp.]|nr:hypothetical protein [Candidatus Methanoperedens sp.]